MSADSEAITQTQIEKARLAGKAKMAGRSPRAVGQEKDNLALRWVYRWGWSAAGIVDAIASPGRRGVASRLVKKGLLEAHDCEAAGGVKGIPHQVVTLTLDGVAEVEADLNEAELLPYPSNSAKLIAWKQLRHDMLVQRWTAQKLDAGKIVGYLTPRQISERSELSIKQPDAVWIIQGQQGMRLRVAIECELTAKFGRELDQALIALLRSVAPKNQEGKGGGPYDLAIMLSHSPGLLDRYKQAVMPGKTIKKWERNAARQWQPSGETTQVPNWSLSRILFEKVEL